MMRHWTRIGAVAAAVGLLALSGCATAPLDRPPLEATLADERALLAAETLYASVLKATNTAIDQGALVPGSPAAVKVADALAKADALMVQARAARAAGQTQAVPALVAQALVILAEVAK